MLYIGQLYDIPPFFNRFLALFSHSLSKDRSFFLISLLRFRIKENAKDGSIFSMCILRKMLKTDPVVSKDGSFFRSGYMEKFSKDGSFFRCGNLEKFSKGESFFPNMIIGKNAKHLSFLPTGPFFSKCSLHIYTDSTILTQAILKERTWIILESPIFMGED